jgi:hypothetical protein
MNDKKIEKEDLARLREFEETILNLQDEDAPKYAIDFEMEAQIKYDALIDHFGVESVSNAFKILDVSTEDLSDPPTYLDIYGYLEAKNKENN